MANYVSVRVERVKASAHRGQRNHDLRLGRVPGYVDQERSAANSVIRAPKTAAIMAKRAAAIRAEAGLPPRKLAIVAVRGIITFSASSQPIIEALTTKEQDAYFAKAVQAAARHFNAEIASLVVHRDESAIHGHFDLVAVDKDGRPLSYSMGKGRLSALQDAVGEVFAPVAITRGKRLAERIRDGEPRSKTVHRSVRELHRDLPADLAAARKAAREEVECERERVERARSRAKQTEALIAKRLAAGHADIQKQQERLAKQQAKLAKQEAELDRLERLSADLSVREASLRQKERELAGFEEWRAEQRQKAAQKASRSPRPG